MTAKDDFIQIKRDLVDRIGNIEEFIKESAKRREEYSILMKDINKKLNGDYVIYPPVLGHEQRIMALEDVEKERIRNKETMIKMAVGSITIAVGGAVIWVFDVLRAAFLNKGGH